MRIMVKMLAGGVGLAALAGTAPSTAQSFSWNTPQMAVDRCTDAVQNRLNLRTAYGDLNGARVVEVTNVERRGNQLKVRGLASSNGAGAYGENLYGALGATVAPNLTFRCTVDRYGRIRGIDIDRR